MRTNQICTFIFCALFVAGTAQAVALHDFNLIAFGNVTGNSEVEGRALVYGNVGSLTDTSAKQFAFDTNAFSDPTTIPGVSQNDGLIVGGQVFSTVNMNAALIPNVRIGGVDTGASINNAASVTYSDAGVPAILTAVTNEVNAATSFFDGLTANSTVNLTDTNNAVFTSTPDSSKIAVFDLNASFFGRNGSLDLQGDLTAEMFIFLVTGATSITSSGGLNVFSNEFAQDAFQERIAFYFPGVTGLTLTNGLGGAVIAADADLAFGSPLEGTVVANNVLLNAEIHMPSLVDDDRLGFTDPIVSAVPEPATMCALGLAIAGLGGYVRKRRLA